MKLCYGYGIYRILICMEGTVGSLLICMGESVESELGRFECLAHST